MYLGAYQLGDRLPLVVLCDDTPAAAPVATLYTSPDTVPVFNTRMPQLDRPGSPLLFERVLHIDGRFAPGYYIVQYTWESGGFNRVDGATFRILPGGHVDGAVIALYHFRKPHADFLVQELDSGKIKRGTNPRV